jgi:hypothetical protein
LAELHIIEQQRLVEERKVRPTEEAERLYLLLNASLSQPEARVNTLFERVHNLTIHVFFVKYAPRKLHQEGSHPQEKMRPHQRKEST